MRRNRVTAAFRWMLKINLILISGNSNIFVFLSHFMNNILNFLILLLYSAWTLYSENKITIQTIVFIKT
jgi:hypothetical protein